jgi:hypothetical protein
MLTLEMAIQKIQQLPPTQRNQVIQFIEFLDSAASQTATAPEQPLPGAKAAFFELAGIWKNKNITAVSLRAKAWR